MRTFEIGDKLSVHRGMFCHVDQAEPDSDETKFVVMEINTNGPVLVVDTHSTEKEFERRRLIRRRCNIRWNRRGRRESKNARRARLQNIEAHRLWRRHFADCVFGSMTIQTKSLKDLMKEIHEATTVPKEML